MRIKLFVIFIFFISIASLSCNNGNKKQNKNKLSVPKNQDSTPYENWIVEEKYNLNFKVPKRLKEFPETNNESDIGHYRKGYYLTDDDLIVQYLFIETGLSEEEYNVKDALKSSIETTMNQIKGRSLKIDFIPTDSEWNDVQSEGTFVTIQDNIFFKAYLLFNSGKVNVLTLMAKDNNKNKDKMDYIINSLKINE